MMIRFFMLQPRTRSSEGSHLQLSLHNNCKTEGEWGALIITFIYLDHASFVFATDIPSGTVCSSRYIFHESHDTLVTQNQQEMVEAWFDRQQRGVVLLLVAVFHVNLSVSMRVTCATVPIDRMAMSIFFRFAVRTGPIYRRVVFLVMRGHIALERIKMKYGDLGAITNYIPPNLPTCPSATR